LKKKETGFFGKTRFLSLIRGRRSGAALHALPDAVGQRDRQVGHERAASRQPTKVVPRVPTRP
jgi:hypothetical protein